MSVEELVHILCVVSMFIGACMLSVCVYVCVCTRARMCPYVCVYRLTLWCRHIYVCMCGSVRAHFCVCVCVCLRVCVTVCMYICSAQNNYRITLNFQGRKLL